MAMAGTFGEALDRAQLLEARETVPPGIDRSLKTPVGVKSRVAANAPSMSVAVFTSAPAASRTTENSSSVSVLVVDEEHTGTDER